MPVNVVAPVVYRQPIANCLLLFGPPPTILYLFDLLIDRLEGITKLGTVADFTADAYLSLYSSTSSHVQSQSRPTPSCKCALLHYLQVLGLNLTAGRCRCTRPPTTRTAKWSCTYTRTHTCAHSAPGLCIPPWTHTRIHPQRYEQNDDL